MIQNKKVLAVIPARGGSKGIPNKNLAPLLDKPLINWTIEAARSSQYIDRLILSSDDPHICQLAEAAGCEVPFIRCAELATDEAKTIDVVLDAANRVSGYDLLILLQPTSPLRSSSDIDGCLELLVEQGVHSAVSVTPVQEHPFLVYSMDVGARLEPFVKISPTASLRRQDLPDLFSLNGAIYAAEIEWLRQSQALVSKETVGYQMPIARSIDIDEKLDLALAGLLFQQTSSHS